MKIFKQGWFVKAKDRISTFDIQHANIKFFPLLCEDMTDLSIVFHTLICLLVDAFSLLTEILKETICQIT